MSSVIPWKPYPDPEPGEFSIFTDGSYWEGRGGHKKIGAWCMGVYHTTLSGSVIHETYKSACDVKSSMEAEFLGIMRAFGVLPNTDAIANIYVDVEIDDGMLDLWKSNNFMTSKGKEMGQRKARMAIQKLREEYPNVSIVKVKGHSKIAQQEKVDREVRRFLRREIEKRGWNRSKVDTKKRMKMT